MQMGPLVRLTSWQGHAQLQRTWSVSQLSASSHPFCRLGDPLESSQLLKPATFLPRTGCRVCTGASCSTAW